MSESTINAFKSGVHNLIDAEAIPKDAASDEKNWYVLDGNLKLIPGRLRIGAEGSVGAIYGQIFGYKADGTKVHWRKTSTKIQYFNGTAWVDVVSGLTADADYTFANYSSLAGTFTYAFGADGIYKFHNANPIDYIAMYVSNTNFKGFGMIDRGRALMWGRKEDKTGLYGSKVDPQGTNYTTVAAEVLGAFGATTYTGTLAARSGTRTAFGVTITGTTGAGVETFTDSYTGVLTGSRGGTGTINYMTGAYSVTFSGVVTAGNVTAAYQWEDSNVGGVTDFRKSATRVAGEGFVFPQDEGGDAIMTVLVGQDGKYYSLKKESAYSLYIADNDLDATNEVFRRQIGVTTLRSGISTSKGIVFLNTANPTRPEMTVLRRNITGDNVEPVQIFPQFAFGNYVYTDCALGVFEQYVLVACKTPDAVANDTILLCNMTTGTVDICKYSARTFARNDYMYIGSTVTQSVYQLFTGFDDDGYSISNYWVSRDELYDTNKRKRFRKLRFKGNIDPDQYISVYISYDFAAFSLIGTIRGSGDYVDDTESSSIGGDAIGADPIGGSTPSSSYPFYMEIKPKVQRFRSRRIKLVAEGIGYVDFSLITDHDITLFDDKLPARFRTKQNVSLDGLSTNLSNPE